MGIYDDGGDDDDDDDDDEIQHMYIYIYINYKENTPLTLQPRI